MEINERISELPTTTGGVLMDVVDRQKRRAVVDRKAYLINELLKMNADIDQDKRLSEFNLVELEQMHINEKCKSANVFAYVRGVSK